MCVRRWLNVSRSLVFPIALTAKKTLVVIKTIVKARNPGDVVENEATNSETLNLKSFFRKLFVNFQSFLLAFDLIREYYVISFLVVFHVLIWISTSFLTTYFIISTSRKPLGTRLVYCFCSLKGVKITRNWNFHPQTKYALIFY